MPRKRQHIDELLTQGKELIEYYRAHPCTAAYELLGVDLAPIQRLVFRDMWFKNYVITVAGRGYGKSRSVNSMVHVNEKGLVYLSEVLPQIPQHLQDGEEEVIDWSEEVYTSEGFRNTKKLCLEKGVVGKKLVTQNRLSSKCSSHHPLLILNKDCELDYKSIAEFAIGDRICIQRGQNVFGNNEVSEDDGYLIGQLVGDGSIGENSTPGITTEDDETKLFCINYCKNNNVPYRVTDDKRTKNVSQIFFKGFDGFFTKHTVDRVTSYTKSVPYSIRTATRESQIAFLQGYFDSDGTADSRCGGASCCSVSKKLLKEIQLMLLNFGIVSRIRKKKTKSAFGKAYLLDMFSEDAFKFKELIGFRLERKQIILDTYFNEKKCNVNKDTIPYALQLCHSITKYYHNKYPTSKKPSFRIRTSNKNEITYERLHKFLIQCKEIEDSGFSLSEIKKDIGKLEEILKYNYYFDTVSSVENWKGDCYDFEMAMEEGVEPNYFANGFINHNTFLLGTLAALSCMLYPGYRVGLIGPVFRQSVALTNCNHSTFWTSDGLKTGVENFYNSVIPNTTKIQSNDYQNDVVSKWKDKDKACKYIKTTKGFELAGTIDHAIVCLDDNLNTEFKDLQDIKDEYIAIKVGFNYFGNDNTMPKFEFEHNWRTKDCLIPKELTPDLSYWMGLLLGDGCVSVSKNKRKQRVDFVSEDQDLLDAFENNLRKYFCVDKEEKIDRRNRRNDTWEIQYYCKKLIQYLLNCDFTKTTALGKKIPSILKKAAKDNLVACLQGLYDTDGCVYVQKNTNGCTVSFNTSSKQLAKEVQAILLNLGIISSFGISNKACVKQLPQGNKPSKCAEAYKVRITGIPHLINFNDIVGFRCKRKKGKLNDYLFSITSGRDTLPIEIGLPASVIKKNRALCTSYAEQGLYFVKVKEVDYFFSDTIDIEVENEHCYWANGFINHNSKMIFSEVEKLYDQSSILREATAKKPTRGSDTAYLKFKSAAGKTPSYIEALPLGDGCLTNCSYSTFYDRFDTIGSSHNLDIEENHYINRQEAVWGNGKFRQSDSSLCNGKKKTVKIKTKKGFYNEGTANHKFKLVRDSRVTWCRFDDMVVGDRILIDRSYRWHGGNSAITEEHAYSLGFLIGDGCWTDKSRRLGFATLDKELLPLLKRGIGCDYLYPAADGVHYFACSNEKHITQNDVRKNWMDFWGLEMSYAIDKKFPKKILSASRENMSACISGLYDADGHVQVSTLKGGTSIAVGFTNTSEELVDQLHYILLHYGIVAVKMERERNEKWNTVYELLITGKDAKIFYDEIGFSLKRKNFMLKAAIEVKSKWFSYEDVPGIQDVMIDISSNNRVKKGQGCKESRYCRASLIKEKTYITPYLVDCFLKTYGDVDDDRIKLIKDLNNQDIYYDEIVEIGEGEEVTYDIHVPDGNEYCANGFFSHNSKIRGSRFYLILVDELAQVPDQTLDMVVRPMGATSLAPMERVRRLEEQTRLINAGLAIKSDFVEETVNKMVMTSSGYYKFNHMWRRMRDHWKMMADSEAKGQESAYAVWQVPYWDLPEGFLDKNNISEAKRIMSTHEYSMEYEAAMVSDSEGFFKASLLDDCTLGNDFTIQFRGESSKQYIIGIDPNQGGNASCGVVVIEIGKPNKIVNVIELKKQTTQGLTRSVQQLCNQYNIIRIFMDRGGGGKAVCDLLEEGYGEAEPIIDRTNSDHEHLEGRHILEMVNFNPTWIADANFTTKAMFEDKSLLFPDNPSNSTNDLLAKAYINIVTLKSQLLNIVVTQTTTGILHFDTPTKNMNKDLYSALILGAHGARQVEKELEEGKEPILHSLSGLVRSRVGTSFDYLGSKGTTGLQAPPLIDYGLGSAVLKKKLK